MFIKCLEIVPIAMRSLSKDDLLCRVNAYVKYYSGSHYLVVARPFFVFIVK